MSTFTMNILQLLC